MSGDVQPRKRKDKKRKKDDLGVEEPRGTSAALGEGDVFMHSHHDHGTGGHWCAKIIFFSLLFILIGLIGLIILENRGLSELDANSVQSQYSGVLEGWLEDAPDDDHHDEHTLELKHHDDNHDDGHDEEPEQSEEADDEHDGHDDDVDDDEDNDEADDDEPQNDEPQDDEEEDEEGTQDNDDDEQDDNDSQEQDLEDNAEEEDLLYRKYYQDTTAEPDDNDDGGDGDDDEDEDDQEDDSHENYEDDDEENGDANDDNDDEDDQDDNLSNEVGQNDDENDDDDAENNQSVEQDNNNYGGDDDDSNEQNNEEEEDHDDEEEDDTSLEVEKIEQEAPEGEDPIDNELPALPEQDDDVDDNDDKGPESVEDESPDDDDAGDADDADDDDNDANEPDDDFLEADDDEPPVERISAPSGKPFDEVEDEPSSEKPTDTLEDEEEYEKRQEQLRKEEAEASHMWLKLSIGGALLVATHAIIRRATASSDVPRSEQPSREVTPAVDRRMTLIPEEQSEAVSIKKGQQESSRPMVQEMTKQIPSITRKSPTFEDSEEEEDVISKVKAAKEEEKKELYSDEEEAEEEDIEEEEPVVQKKAATAAVSRQAAKPKEPTPEPEEDVPDDVEIIDDEQIEEEDEEQEDEEEISDVDDEELLTRLEAKYGRLPEPERPMRRKDGGNSIEDAWPGEPADSYWRQQLDDAEREFNQGALMAAADRAGAPELRSSARARWIAAKSLDAAAEKKRDNALLGRAIAAYLELLKMNERLSDKKLLEIAERTINRIQFRGTYLSAEPVYRLLIRRFPDEPAHRTNLTVAFLMANRNDLAEEALKETLKRWPNDRLALAQYGFILKTQHNRLEEALDLLQKALDGDTGPATEPRFYYHLGDTLLLLGRFEEAHEVHKRGAAKGHFLSPAQRSLYNVPRLVGRPWWNAEDTPYMNLVRDLEKNWKTILREGEAAKALYEQEKEGLKERGEWSQLDLFVRGREIDGRCARAPVTCAVVRREAAAAGCRRGQIKFSSMRPGTHVRPHVGPTNCRLRMHLGLSNTKDTFIRVHKETRQWETGKVLIFDDSFEHEVWHNGTGSRLVLIVDVWHPGLTANERRTLPAI